MKTRSTYHADCLCGKPITSKTRETKCPDCGRLLVFEWGGDPVPAKLTDFISSANEGPADFISTKTPTKPLEKAKGASA